MQKALRDVNGLGLHPHFDSSANQGDFIGETIRCNLYLRRLRTVFKLVTQRHSSNPDLIIVQCHQLPYRLENESKKNEK